MAGRGGGARQAAGCGGGCRRPEDNGGERVGWGKGDGDEGAARMINQRRWEGRKGAGGGHEKGSVPAEGGKGDKPRRAR